MRGLEGHLTFLFFFFLVCFLEQTHPDKKKISRFLFDNKNFPFFVTLKSLFVIWNFFF